MVYPETIAKRLKDVRHLGLRVEANSTATGASFSCGSFVRFSLFIDVASGIIADVRFASNGCGYMVASADVLAESLKGQRLTDLHGLADTELSETIVTSFGSASRERKECVDVCFQALHSALADFRASRIEEFAGEKALICTCFGVTEERIEEIIRDCSVESVEDVSAVCNAGLGCGSCRMMIEEMIDARVDQP